MLDCALAKASSNVAGMVVALALVPLEMLSRSVGTGTKLVGGVTDAEPGLADAFSWSVGAGVKAFSIGVVRDLFAGGVADWSALVFSMAGLGEGWCGVSR